MTRKILTILAVIIGAISFLSPANKLCGKNPGEIIILLFLIVWVEGNGTIASVAGWLAFEIMLFVFREGVNFNHNLHIETKSCSHLCLL